ncbi:MAG: SAM-dependent methyltransferase [Trebonia sp.]
MPSILLDLTRPVALLFVGCLHHVLDSEGPAGFVARYLTALAPGSFLVISHSTNDFSPEKMSANAAVADQSGAILVSYWRPDADEPDRNADKAWVYGGVAAI